MTRLTRALRFVLPAWFILLASVSAHAQSPNLAPNFHALPKGVGVLLMQPDIELFSISVGGVPEPKADWTEAAIKHVESALNAKTRALGVVVRNLSDDAADEFAEVNSLHAAVARSIALHHITGGNFKLPTKDGKLDWSLGDSVRTIGEKTKSDYALFLWMRDSYATAERKVAMVAMALLGVGIAGGAQVGYASLVDLRNGQVLWFNQILRGTGDLREADSARETIATLLKNFPSSR